MLTSKETHCTLCPGVEWFSKSGPHHNLGSLLIQVPRPQLWGLWFRGSEMEPILVVKKFPRWLWCSPKPRILNYYAYSKNYARRKGRTERFCNELLRVSLQCFWLEETDHGRFNSRSEATILSTGPHHTHPNKGQAHKSVSESHSQ